MPHTIIDLPGEVGEEQDFTEALREEYDYWHPPQQSVWVLSGPPPPDFPIFQRNPNGTRDRMFKMLREKRL